MKLSFCVVLSALFVAGGQLTHADDPNAKPASPEKPLRYRDISPGGSPPLIGYVQGISKDGLSLEVHNNGREIGQLARRVVDREEDVLEGEKVVTKTVREERTILVPFGDARASVQKYRLDQVRAYDIQGRRIPAAKLPELFAKPRTILWQSEGFTTDARYFSASRDDTPFLVLPSDMIAPRIPASPPDLITPRIPGDPPGPLRVMPLTPAIPGDPPGPAATILLPKKPTAVVRTILTDCKAVGSWSVFISSRRRTCQGSGNG